MAWPTNKPDNNSFGSDSDSIRDSRVELEKMSAAVNNIIDFIDTTGIQNNHILVYDSGSATFKVGQQMTHISAGDNITVDQDSAGGVIISSAAGGISSPLSEDIETGHQIIGHLIGDDSAEGEATAMQFSDDGIVSLFHSNDYVVTRDYDDVKETKISNYRTGRKYISVGGLADPSNTAFGAIALWSENEAVGRVSSARVGVGTAGKSAIMQVLAQDEDKDDSAAWGTTYYFSAEISMNKDDGLVLRNNTDGSDSAGVAASDSAGDHPASINLRTTWGNINLEPAGKIMLKYADWPASDGTNGQILTTNGAGTLSWSTSTAPASAFTQIAVSGQDTVESDGAADQLTFVAGTGMTITTNAGADSITFASSGGGSGTDLGLTGGDNIVVTQDSSAGYTISQGSWTNPIDANEQVLTDPGLKGYTETVHDLGTSSGTKTPDKSDGNVQKITLNGNLTLNAFASPAAGDSITLIITQDGTGNRELSSTMKFASASKTLSTAGNAIDVVSMFYDGSRYFASLSKGFA